MKSKVVFACVSVGVVYELAWAREKRRFEVVLQGLSSAAWCVHRSLRGPLPARQSVPFLFGSHLLIWLREDGCVLGEIFDVWIVGLMAGFEEGHEGPQTVMSIHHHDSVWMRAGQKD